MVITKPIKQKFLWCLQGGGIPPGNSNFKRYTAIGGRAGSDYVTKERTTVVIGVKFRYGDGIACEGTMAMKSAVFSFVNTGKSC